jgi:hypothetical protein
VNDANDEMGTTEIWAEAIRNLRNAKERVARRYNEARRETRFKVGTWWCIS